MVQLEGIKKTLFIYLSVKKETYLDYKSLDCEKVRRKKTGEETIKDVLSSKPAEPFHLL